MISCSLYLVYLKGNKYTFKKAEEEEVEEEENEEEEEVEGGRTGGNSDRESKKVRGGD